MYQLISTVRCSVLHTTWRYPIQNNPTNTTTVLHPSQMVFLKDEKIDEESDRLLTNHRKDKKEDANGLGIVGVGVGHMLHFTHHLTCLTICHDS